MNKKKIIILAMSCNQDFFQHQEEIIKTTYAKDIIEGKYPNIEFWIYTASFDTKYHVNHNEHKLYIPSDDSLNGTYEKTIKALKLINTLKIEYDYIFRTNCSTYINIELLDRFINECQLNDETIYTGAIYCTDNGTGPFNWCYYGVGNAILFSKYWINILLTNKPYSFKNYVVNKNEPYYKIDDNTIGLIVNGYLFKNHKDMFDAWQNFDFPMINNIPDKPQNYIAIPCREYNPENTRDNEEKYMKDIHNIIKENDIKQININNILSNKTVHILDFNRGMHSIITRDYAEIFLNIMSLPKYLANMKR